MFHLEQDAGTKKPTLKAIELGSDAASQSMKNAKRNLFVSVCVFFCCVYGIKMNLIQPYH
jgi:hypothetical protein